MACLGSAVLAAQQRAISNEQEDAGAAPKGGGPCSSLSDLLPIEANLGPAGRSFRVSPGPLRGAGLPTGVGFPWGGAVAEEPEGRFCTGSNLFYTEWLNHCPITFDTFYTSTSIAHATAPTLLGPWTRAAAAVVFPAAGNPALSRAPDGTWLLYYTNHRQPAAVVSAARNCSGPVDMWGNCSTNPAVFPWNKSSPCGSQAAGEPFGISLAYTKDLNHGPWKYQENVISVPASNPGGPFFLPNGTMLMPFQTWRPGHPCTTPTCISIVSAPSWDA